MRAQSPGRVFVSEKVASLISICSFVARARRRLSPAYIPDRRRHCGTSGSSSEKKKIYIYETDRDIRLLELLNERITAKSVIFRKENEKKKKRCCAKNNKKKINK